MKISQRGISKMQLMLALFFLIGIGLVVIKMSQYGTLVSQNLEASMGKSAWLIDLFRTRMNQPRACLDSLTLKGSNPYVDKAKEIPFFYDSMGAKLIKVGDLVPSGSHRIQKMLMKPFLAKSPKSKNGVCPVQVTFELLGKDSNNFVDEELMAEPNPGAVEEMWLFPCVVSLNKASSLVLKSCSNPESINLDSPWDIIFPNPGTDDFAHWNPTKKTGHVLIGPQTPENEMMAALNINQSGVAWTNDPLIELEQGLRLRPNNVLVWDNYWVFAADDKGIYFGTGLLNNFDHVGLMVQAGNKNSGKKENIVFASTNRRPLEVSGDIYSEPNHRWDKSNEKQYRLGLLTEKNDVYVDFNRLWRNYQHQTPPGGLLTYNNPNTKDYGGFLRFNSVQNQFSLYLTDQKKEVEDIENYHQMSLFPNYRFLFTNKVHLDQAEKSGSGTDPNSSYLFSLGEDLTSNGKFLMNLGKLNQLDCHYCFVLGKNNQLKQANYSFVMGENLTAEGKYSINLGLNNINHADFSFVGGGGSHEKGFEQGNLIKKEANYGLAYGKGLIIQNPYEVAFGKYNQSVSSVTEGTRLSIGDGSLKQRRNILTYYNSGSLRLSTFGRNYFSSGKQAPGDLFIHPPYHETSQRYDSDFILAYNLHRQCSADSCQYQTYGDEKVNPYSGLSLGIKNGIALYSNHLNRKSKNNRRQAKTLKTGLSSSPVVYFKQDGIYTKEKLEIGGNLTAKIINHRDWSTPSDQDLKEQIKLIDAKENMEKIKKLNPLSFEYIVQRGKKTFGFMAQEIAKIYPSLVEKMNDGFLSLNMNSFSAIIVSGIQYLYSKILQLKQYLEQVEEDLLLYQKELDDFKLRNRQLLKFYCHKTTVKEDDLCVK